MSTLTVLDWPVLLATPDTRWYLDRLPWSLDTGRCAWQADCHDPVVAYMDYQIVALPGDSKDSDDIDCDESGLVCSAHLPAIIEYVTGEPLVVGTVVEVGVDPALLRLTGVDPAVVARFNDDALGVLA